MTGKLVQTCGGGSATTLKMEAVNCSEMSETNYRSIRPHIQQKAILTTRHAAIQHAVLWASVAWLWKLVSSAVCVPATTTTCDHDSALFFSIGTRVTLSKEVSASFISFESFLKTAVNSLPKHQTV